MTTFLAALAVSLTGPVAAEGPGDLFIIHQLDQPPDAAVAQVRAFTEAEEDWLFLAEFGLAGGQVTALKICYPAIGPDIVAAGWHTMAMMPCGHLAFYGQDGQSMLSTLDPIHALKAPPLRPGPPLPRCCRMFWEWNEPRHVVRGADMAAAGGERSGWRATPCRTPPPARYGRLHARFLRLAGGEAEAALEAALVMLLRPGLRVLDAGCGPGTVARRLLAQEPRIDLTLIDNDPEMLFQCHDIGGLHLLGTLENLPLRN